MDHGVSSRLALSAPSNPESKSPRVKRAKTDPPYGAFIVGHYQPPPPKRSVLIISVFSTFEWRVSESQDGWLS